MRMSAPTIRSSRRPWRSTAIAAAVLLSAVLLVLGNPLADKASATTIPIVFPLEIRVPVLHDYLAQRSGHLHQGTDLLAPKMTKELAAVSGTVTLRTSSYAGVPAYSLWLAGDDGHGYFYIHINNDTPGTDDGAGGLQYAFAPGLTSGSHVDQGQFIAYVGDSGNAEYTVSHLHFEIHQTTSMSSASIDPYDSVYNAPLASDPSTPIRYEQNDTRLTYLGTWYTNSSAAGASGSSFRYTNVPGASVTVKFTGAYLAWVTKTSPLYGIAKVTLDGEDPQLVDLYSESDAWQQTVWETGDLTYGTHTVTIECDGGKNDSASAAYIGLDAFDIIGYPTQAPTLSRYQQNNAKLTYLGTWYNNCSATSASGGSFRYTNVSEASVTVRFTGTYLAWITKKSPLYGMAQVTMDGGDPQQVDLYGAGDAWQQKVWNTGTLAYGTHTVTIECTGGKNDSAADAFIGVDAFDVMGTLDQAPTITRYQQSNAKVVYAGTWYNNWSATSASGGSFRYTDVSGSSVTINFTGTYLAWITKKSSVYGIAQVTVDGGDPQPVDLYSASELWQQKVWETGTLTSGAHTVTIECSGGKNDSATGAYIGVDALDVLGTLD
jgi:Peptidase family M23